MPQIPLTEGYRIAPENPVTQEQFHNIRPNTQATENWGKVGSGLAGGLAVHVGAAMEKAIDDADRTQALTLANELRKRASEFTYGKNGKGGYLNEKGVNALNGNLPEVFGDRLTKATEEIGKKANVRARKYFNQYAARINQGFHDGIDRHIYKESVAVKASERTKAHDMDTQDILQAASIGDYEGMYSAIQQSVERAKQFAAEDGIDPEIPKVVGNQVMMAAATMMQNNADYKTVQGFIAGAKASGYLSTEQATRLSKAGKDYVLDKRSDEIVDKAFARFANNEAAGLAWINKQSISPDPDDNAVLRRKMLERYNAQDAVKKAAWEQGAEMYSRALVNAASRGITHPNPKSLPGFNQMSPQAQASAMMRYSLYLESEARKRSGGGGGGGGRGGGGGTGDNAIVSGIRYKDGTVAPITKGEIKQFKGRVDNISGTDAGRELLAQQNYEGETKGLGKYGIVDGIPWGAIYTAEERGKLRVKQSQQIPPRAKEVRTQAEAHLLAQGMNEKDAKDLAATICANAEQVIRDNEKNINDSKKFKPDLFLTPESRGKFIVEQVSQADTRSFAGFTFGKEYVANLQQKNRTAQLNAITAGNSPNEATFATVTSPVMASESEIYLRADRAYASGIQEPESPYATWARSIRDSGNKMPPLTRKQKQILNAQDINGRIDPSRIPSKLYAEGVELAIPAMQVDRKNPQLKLTREEARRFVSPKAVVGALARKYFPDVTKTAAPSAGSVAVPVTATPVDGLITD